MKWMLQARKSINCAVQLILILITEEVSSLTPQWRKALRRGNMVVNMDNALPALNASTLVSLFGSGMFCSQPHIQIFEAENQFSTSDAHSGCEEGGSLLATEVHTMRRFSSQIQLSNSECRLTRNAVQFESMKYFFQLLIYPKHEHPNHHTRSQNTATRTLANNLKTLHEV